MRPAQKHSVYGFIGNFKAVYFETADFDAECASAPRSNTRVLRASAWSRSMREICVKSLSRFEVKGNLPSANQFGLRFQIAATCMRAAESRVSRKRCALPFYVVVFGISDRQRNHVRGFKLRNLKHRLFVNFHLHLSSFMLRGFEPCSRRLLRSRMSR